MEQLDIFHIFSDCYPRGSDAKKRSDDRYEICGYSLIENYLGNIYVTANNSIDITGLIEGMSKIGAKVAIETGYTDTDYINLL